VHEAVLEEGRGAAGAGREPARHDDTGGLDELEILGMVEASDRGERTRRRLRVAGGPLGRRAAGEA
jgi:hypothetical protein